MNMSKLAKLAGCSISTVSKAFRNSQEISPETRDRIFEIAKQNNCFERYYSPIYKKRVFAVICKDLITSIYDAIVDSLNVKITANGDTLLISNCNFVDSAFNDLIEYYVNFHRVDGLIIISSQNYNLELHHNIPIVMICERDIAFSSRCDRVIMSNDYGIEDGVSYLQKMGHKKIGFIGEYLTKFKRTFFLNSLAKFGLEQNESWILTSKMRKGEAGYDGMDRILSLSSKPTAFFAAYDAIAFGAINRLHSAGFKVPDDFSIISCDNIPLSKFACPPLSTIATPVDEITDAALNLLNRRLQNKDANFQSITIQSELIIRESVKKLS